MGQTKGWSSEAAEQACLMRWAEYQAAKWPELRMMYHIPNGGSRNKAEAAHLKAQGVKAGVPDICLPVARGGYHGLYIELKRRAGGRVSAEQKAWLHALRAGGYAAVLCKGWEAACTAIVDYMSGKTEAEHGAN